MLLLIDGNSILYTCYYGTLPKQYVYAKTSMEKQNATKYIMQNSEGNLTNGVFLMTKKILKIIQTYSPEYIAVAWDCSRNTFRHKLFPGYKSNRKPAHTGLVKQIPLMQNILTAMGISQYQHPDYEADDILATLAWGSPVPVFILTKDQDLLQLVSGHVSVWLMNGAKNAPGTEFTPTKVLETYGISPIQVPDLKALAGDPADNIPGVPGIGPKTAIPLLNKFDSVESIYNAIDKDIERFKSVLQELPIRRSPLNALIMHKNSAFLSKKLALLAEVPLQASNGDLKYKFNTLALRSIFQRLEFNSLSNIA